MDTRQAPAGFAYVPALLPDELLYSWLARLSRLNAMGTSRECMLRIFGYRHLAPSVDLPTRLLALQEQLHPWLPLANLDALIEGTTLLPYHRPFLTTERHTRARQIMLQGSGQGLKTLMGRVANRFGAHPPLRSCPNCLADSLHRHGSFYWMRRHQLPGVHCCSIHGSSLQSVPLQTHSHPKPWILPAITKSVPHRIHVDERQLRFARLSDELVAASLPVIDPAQRAATYRTAALALGHGTRRGCVDFAALADSLRQRFDDFEGFEHQERLLAPAAHPLGWLRPLIDRPQQASHPICHLLLIEFLFGSVANFKAAYGDRSVAPNDPPPGQSSSDHAMVHLEARDKIEKTGAQKTLRDTSLTCRQVAEQLGLSVTTVVSRRRAQGIPVLERRKLLRQAVVERVLQALRLERSLPVVAASTGVSLSSVYRILARHPAAPRPRPRPPHDCDSVRARRRANWAEALHACRIEGMDGATAARKRAGADYAWLYRHDRAWLASTTQECRCRFAVPLRVDWAQRDTELCQALQRHLVVLRAESPPRRMTRTRLLRLLGEAMVRRNLHHMPKLDALLTQTVESALNFGMRLIDHAVSTLLREGGVLQLWRIKRRTGLRRWSSALTDHANRLLERLDAQNPLRADAISR